MNIINQDNIYRIFGDGIGINTTLPAFTYKVCFARTEGFFLEKINDFSIINEKIYGAPNKRVDKIFRMFNISERNLGIICSGSKGSGKTLLAKLVAQRGIAEQIPVIIVDQAIPGIADFIASIEQECIIIFDEFDKVFFESGNDGVGAALQDELLTLFDGIHNGRKIFFITCNDVEKLNDCFLGRPGRFHYHFQYDRLSAIEIEEYLNNEIKITMDPNERKRLSLNCSFSKMSYDILRAICTEINLGYELDEIFEDLNVDKFNNEFYFDIYMKGELVGGLTNFIPFSRNFGWSPLVYDKKVVQAKIEVGEEAMNFENGVPIFDVSKISVSVDSDDFPFVEGEKCSFCEVDISSQCEFGIREKASIRKKAI